MTSQTPPLNLGVRRLTVSLFAILTASMSFGQQTAAQPANPADKQKEETVELSPFVVTTNKNAGYFAANTLAGSRINTDVADLASSITVITKQQMRDTTSTNINDVFMYEASTEGANTYTQTDVSRNGIPRDTIAGYSSDQGVPGSVATANRLRGLSAPDAAQNNYPAIPRVPFDSYNTNSLEISRGPNSLIFGTGTPAGIVNQSTAQAVLNKQTSELEFRFGSWGDQRVSLSHNQPLIEDTLALYVAGLWGDVGYRRKPSDDVTKRGYAALTYKPFQKTKFTGSFEYFGNHNSRPNAQTPRDFVTPWLNAGRPAYDPISRTVTILSTGQVIGPYVTDTRSPGWVPGVVVGAPALTSTTSPQYVPGIQFGPAGSARALIFTDNAVPYNTIIPTGAAFTTLVAPYTAYNAPAAASRTPAQWMFADRRLTGSTGPLAPAAPGGGFYGNYVAPSTTDINIYEYEHINLLQMNYQQQTMRTYNLEFEQELMQNPDWGNLNFTAGWFRQDLKSMDNFTMSNANAITTLYVDTNKYNMDGTPNAHFGNPYLLDISPDTFLTPEKNDNLRAMLAYELDLTKKSGWVRFFGRQRVLALWSKQDDTQSTFRYRYSFDGGDLRYQANPTAANAIVASSNLSRLFYVGNNDQGTVTYAPGWQKLPGQGGPQTTPVQTYNWTTSSWETSTLQMDQNLFYAGAYGPLQKIITGQSVSLQSYFWDDRIITTVGVRKDDYKARQTLVAGTTTTNTGLPTDIYVNGFAIDPAWTYSRLTAWNRLDGKTKSAGVVFKVLRWNGGELSLRFNKSDNFNPPNGIPVDFFGAPIPKSTGDGKDYGIGLSMFNNKLVARVNWFETNNINAPATAATTAIGRVSREDTSSFRSWATFVVRIRHGEDPTNPNFNNNTAFPLSATEKTEIAALMQVPSYDNWPPAGISGTQSNTAKGTEFELTYNPVPNWNIKFTAAKINSTYSDVAPQIDAWVGSETTAGSRLNVWSTAVAADMPALITLSNGTPVSLQHFWTGYGFNADALLSNASSANPSWISPQGFWNSAVATEISVAKALQGKAVPNERPYSFSVISNYAFQKGKLRGFGVGGAYRWADQAIAGFYGDPNKRDSTNNIVAPDLTRPIMTPSEGHLDLWVSWRHKFNKVGLTVQFNVRDALQDGKLQPISFNLDGSAAQYRIIDPRQYYLTTTFDF